MAGSITYFYESRAGDFPALIWCMVLRCLVRAIVLSPERSLFQAGSGCTGKPVDTESAAFNCTLAQTQFNH